jgi:hypothetical protein
MQHEVFTKALQDLDALSARFAQGDMAEWEHRGQRGVLLGTALTEVAAEFSVGILYRMTIDQDGDLPVVTTRRIVGETVLQAQFGEGFAALLNRYGAHVAKPGDVGTSGGWCFLNHEAGERLLRDYAKAKAKAKDKAAGNTRAA